MRNCGLSPAFAPGNEIHENHHEGNNEQDVNDSAHGVTADETEQPEDDENHCECV